MKQFILLSALLFSVNCVAQNSVVFSDYTSDLKIKAVDAENLAIQFDGSVEVSGTLIFSFDAISENETGELISVNFIPREDQVKLFPHVVSGFYAQVLQVISFYNSDQVYQQVLEGVERVKTPEVRIAGSIKLKHYSTIVECDSRQYIAEFISFSSNDLAGPANIQEISGCS